MRAFTVAACFGLAATTFATHAQAQALPKQIAWTAYDVGSAGYNQAVGIGAALKNKAGITLRVLPGKNDVSRLVPLREGKVQFSAFGIGAYQAIEAVDIFGSKDWGPQDVRMMAMNNNDACSTLLLGGDLDIKSMADLKGKRIAWVKGAPSLNLNSLAMLRFGGLTWDDVKKVEFGGYSASFDGLSDGQVDAVYTLSSAGNVFKVFSTPRGGKWVPLPHGDTAAWKRMQDAAPYFYKTTCREGGGVTQPFESANYPYPVLIAYAKQDAGMVYEMTKLMFDLYPDYKDSAPSANGWGIEKQQYEWVVPFHDGAIRYYKEIGKWTPAAQSNQEKLLARQQVINKGWAAFMKGAPSDEAAFVKGWQKARADALTAAKLEVVFTDW